MACCEDVRSSEVFVRQPNDGDIHDERSTTDDRVSRGLVHFKCLGPSQVRRQDVTERFLCGGSARRLQIQSVSESDTPDDGDQTDKLDSH